MSIIFLDREEYTELLPSGECGAIIEAVVTDSSCVGDDIYWLPNPNMLRGEIHSLKYSEYDQPKRTNGSVMLRLPGWSDKVEYGDLIQVHGVFSDPEPPLFKGGFDMERYLKSKGAGKLFIADKCKIIAKNRASSVYFKVLKIRNYMLDRVTDGLRHSEKIILGALTFGCRQGLTWNTRKAFIKSGTIHVFAVSGLHIGMLAFLLLWLLRWVSFRIRYLLIPALLAVYVTTTGMQPSALRALLMITIFCIHRSCLYTTSPLNVVFQSASIILILSPVSLLDIGFQYSFITAGFLVLSWTSVNRWLELYSEKNRWVVSKYHKFHSILFTLFSKKVFTALASCSIAWIASSGITLFYNGFYVPFAVFINFIILPFIWLTFVISFLKIFFVPVWFIQFMLNKIIELLLDFVTFLTQFSSQLNDSGYIPNPSLWTLPIFYAVLMILITSRTRRRSIISSALLATLVLSWHIGQSFDSSEIMIIHGGESQQPAILLHDRINRNTICINSSSKETGRNIVNYLRNRGITEVDNFVFAHARREFCSGSDTIISNMKVSNIILPETYTRSQFAKIAVRQARLKGSSIKFTKMVDINKKAWHYSDPYLDINSYEDRFILRYINRDMDISMEIRDKPSGEKLVSVKNGKTTEKRYTFLRSANRTVKRVTVN